MPPPFDPRPPDRITPWALGAVLSVGGPVRRSRGVWAFYSSPTKPDKGEGRCLCVRQQMHETKRQRGNDFEGDYGDDKGDGGYSLSVASAFARSARQCRACRPLEDRRGRPLRLHRRKGGVVEKNDSHITTLPVRRFRQSKLPRAVFLLSRA